MLIFTKKFCYVLYNAFMINQTNLVSNMYCCSAMHHLRPRVTAAWTADAGAAFAFIIQVKSTGVVNLTFGVDVP